MINSFVFAMQLMVGVLLALGVSISLHYFLSSQDIKIKLFGRNK